MKYKWRAHTAKKEKRLSLYRSNLIIAHSNTVKKKISRSRYPKKFLKVGRGDGVRKRDWGIWRWSVCMVGKEGTKPPGHRLWRLIPYSLL